MTHPLPTLARLRMNVHEMGDELREYMPTHVIVSLTNEFFKVVATNDGRYRIVHANPRLSGWYVNRDMIEFSHPPTVPLSLPGINPVSGSSASSEGVADSTPTGQEMPDSSSPR